MKETIATLRADLHTQQTNSSTFVDTMARVSLTAFLISTYSNEKKKKIEELRSQLAALQDAKDSLNETINSLRAELRVEHQNSSASIAALTRASLTSKSLRKKNGTSRTDQPRTTTQSR